MRIALLLRSTGFMLIATALSGCIVDPSGPVDNVYPDKTEISQQRAIVADRAQFMRHISNVTTRSNTAEFGNQITYLAANGQGYLWLPERSELLLGRWQVKSDGKVCMQFEARVVIPVAFRNGEGWECGSPFHYLNIKDEIVSGDPLHLTSGKVPFLLPHGDISISEAMRQAKMKNRSLQNLVTWDWRN